MFVLIFNQLLKMLFIMVLAYGCYKAKWVNQEGNRTLSNLLLMVINPFLIITVYQTDYNATLVKGLLISFFAALVSQMIGILISQVLIRKTGNPEYSIERFAAVYANCGFMGIPLINSILGSEGVFYLTAYITIFNILTWTHGLVLIKGKLQLQTLRQGLLSPMILATVLAASLFFLQIRIPETLLDSIQYVADMNTPVSMFIAGISVAQADLKKIFTNFRIYLVGFAKLLAMPLVTLLFLYAANIPTNVAYTILIAAACPTATTTTMMAIRYNKNYTYSSEIFAVTTVLSIVTIPIVAYVAEFFL